MKNKKWKLAVAALIYMFALSLFFCVLMVIRLIKSPDLFVVSSWVGLWLAVFGGVFSILGAFGAANAIDKNTIVKYSQPDNQTGEEK